MLKEVVIAMKPFVTSSNHQIERRDYDLLPIYLMLGFEY